jgi:hypothetical protein
MATAREKSVSDEQFRKLADQLGDWIERDAIIHIPLNSAVERDEDGPGVWVDCEILVPWKRKDLPWNSSRV